MVEPGGDAHFREEAVGPSAAARSGEDLDGDLAVVLEVVGEIDRGHATGADSRSMR